MKTNLRGKIREFIQSEEGKVGIKSPLTLGVVTGSLLLARLLSVSSQLTREPVESVDILINVSRTSFVL